MSIDLKSIPSKPGVYIYKDKDNKIIYVGKAINLKKRVSQYFQKDNSLNPKTQKLVSLIKNINYYIVGSEVEALILEANFIKLYKPKYNSQLTDDKNYIYICISKQDYPRIFTSQLSKLDDKKYLTYGPFPDSTSAKFLLKSIRSIFPFRTFVKYHPKNCLYCHLGLCPGANPNLNDYQKTITKIKKILTGQTKKLIDQLQIEMFAFSKSLNYELALTRKKQIESMVYITSSWKNIGKLTNQINLSSSAWLSAINELKSIFTVSNLNRIEAYDISNSSNFFVGSMVVFQNGIIDNSAYRQFKIKTKSSQDDQYMIAEIVKRRLNHPDWPYPQIILVDGGKPQVSAVMPLIKHKSILLIGLAKKEETIITYVNSNWQEIKLPKYSNALRLLQHLRNESHRYANRYRLKLLKSSYEN